MIRGLRRGRGGLVATQRQYEFLHQVLEQMLWGGGEGEGERERGMAEEIDGRTKLSKKKKKHKKPKGLQFPHLSKIALSVCISYNNS